jgi:O-antigen/teichoic acid export membrane protein
MKFSFSQKFLRALLGNAVSAFIFLIFFILAARKLEIYQFGLLSILYTLSLLLADVSDFGTGAYALLDKNPIQVGYSHNRFRRLSVNRTTFFLCISPIALLPFVFNWNYFWVVFSVLCCSFVMSIRILLQTDLRFQGRYTQLGISQVFDRSGSLVLLILIRPTTAEGALLAVSLSSLLTLLVFRWKPILRINFRRMVGDFKQASSLGLSSLMSDLALLDILILAFISDPNIVAKYSLVARFCAPILLVGATISLVAVKELNIEFTRESELKEKTRQLLYLTFGTCISISIGVFLVSDLIIGRFLPGQYDGANGLLVFALIGSILYSVWQVISAVLQSQTMYSKNLVFTVTIGFSYLLIILLLTRMIAQYAIPVAQVLVYSISIILGARFLLRGAGRS